MRTTFKYFALLAGLAAVFLTTALIVRAQDTNTNSAPAPSAPAKPVPYPFDHCLVSGEKFGGDMGDPVVFVYTNNGYSQEIKFCCNMCKPKFLKDPDKYMKIILAAEDKQTNH